MTVNNWRTMSTVDYSNGSRPNLTISSAAVQLPFAPWLTAVFAVLTAVASFVTVSGNLLVIASFFVERVLRSPTNYFIASLAVTDLLIGIFSMNFYTLYLLLGSWPLGETFCDLWLSLDFSACLTSQYTVFFITVDRFCSIKIPAKYRTWRSEEKVKIMVAATWIIPVTVFFTSIVGWPYFTGGRSRKPRECVAEFQSHTVFNTVLTICYYWVTLVVMCTLYAGIYKVALRLQKKSEARKRRLHTLIPDAHPADNTQNAVVTQTETMNMIDIKRKSSRNFSKKQTKRERNSVSYKTAAVTRSDSPILPSDSDTPDAEQHHNDRTTTTGTTEAANDAFRESPDHRGHGNELPKVVIKEDTEDTRSLGLSVSTNTSVVHRHQHPPSARYHNVEYFLNAPPHVFERLRFIDTESIRSGQSNDNMRLLGDLIQPRLIESSVKPVNLHPERPGSPVWKKQPVQSCYNNTHHTNLNQQNNINSTTDEVTPINTSIIGAPTAKTYPETTTIASPVPTSRDINDTMRRRLSLKGKAKHKASVRHLKNASASRTENRARKALRTITLILGAFVACWTPYHIFVLVKGACDQPGPPMYTCINDHLFSFSYWLCYMNSPINPFCYALANAQFKKTFLRILRGDFHRT